MNKGDPITATRNYRDDTHTFRYHHQDKHFITVKEYFISYGVKRKKQLLKRLWTISTPESQGSGAAQE